MGATTRNNFFIMTERHVEDNNGVRRESLPYPWDEVIYKILKYISYDERSSIICSFHFRLLHELRYKEELPIPKRLSVPHFLLQYIIEMGQNVREGKHQQISHHGIIKLIVMDALSHLRNLVLWTNIVDMEREIFIGTKAITHEETPTSSIGGKEGKKEEEEEE